MRRHPFMICFCIFLRQQSQSAYKHSDNLNAIVYHHNAHYVTIHTMPKQVLGSSEINSQLCSAANIEEPQKRDKCIMLLMNEMYLKENLVYDKHTVSVKNLANSKTKGKPFQHSYRSEDDFGFLNNLMIGKLVSKLVHNLICLRRS
uniref:Uncharacterized protein n=1 Tax=Amphimedon queenslandica TaxID=400682 RepID=A0A1X7UXQ7_AMPQE